MGLAAGVFAALAYLREEEEVGEGSAAQPRAILAQHFRGDLEFPAGVAQTVERGEIWRRVLVDHADETVAAKFCRTADRFQESQRAPHELPGDWHKRELLAERGAHLVEYFA